MGRRNQQDVIDRVLSSVRERIRRDAGEYQGSVRRVLDHLAEHFTDPALDGNSACRAAQITSQSYTTRFRAKVGVPLKSYITAHRIEAAAELLRETDLRIWKVAHLVGYNVPLSFSRAFKRHVGTLPVQYQALHRAGLALEGGSEDTSVRIDAEEARRVVDKILLRHPEIGQLPGPLFIVDADEFVTGKAGEVWKILRDREPQQHRDILRLWRFTDPALVDLLLEKSIVKGRADRGFGVHLVELALYVIEISRDVLKVDVTTLTARAWAWLGNARRLTHDYVGAEEALRRSEHLLATKLTREAKRARAEMLSFSACLKDVQNDSTAALTLADKAVELFEEIGDLASAAKAFTLKGNILGWADDLEAANENHLKGLNLARACDDRDIQVAGLAGLALNHANLGNMPEASSYLEDARGLTSRSSESTAAFQLDWAEGLIEMGRGHDERAEIALVRAREGLSRLRELNYAALVSVDLMEIYRRAGRTDDLLGIAREVRTIFRALKADKKIAAADQILSRALVEQSLNLEALRVLRDHLCKAGRGLSGNADGEEKGGRRQDR